MIIISHRGNLDGPTNTENSPKMIRLALSMDFFVEVDAWQDAGSCYTGHDKPEYILDLYDPYIIWHAKNFEVANHLEKLNQKWFSHDKDKFAVINNMSIEKKKVLWGFTDSFDKNETFKSIVVIPDNNFDQYEKEIYSGIWDGICTDYPIELRSYLNKKGIK